MVVYYRRAKRQVKAMLMEELFSRGIMTMGPSRTDPERRVGIFQPDFVAGLPDYVD
jgi:hypothetical protein